MIMEMKHNAIVKNDVKKLDDLLNKLPQWRLEDGADGEVNKWWVKRNRSIDNKTVLVTKIMRGIEAESEKYISISANFDCKTGVQIDAERVVVSSNIDILIGN